MKAKVRFGILGAFVALAGALGVAGSGNLATPVSAQVPAGLAVAKVCGATSIAVTGTTTCTVTVTATAAAAFNEPLVLTVGPGATTHGGVRLLNATSGATGPDVDAVAINNPANGGAQTITIGCTGATCDFAVGDTIVIQEGIQGAVGGPTTESLQFGGGVPVALAPTVTVQPATTQLVAGNATATLISCVPNQIQANSGNAGASVCTIDLDDNDINPDAVSSGTVTVTVSGPAGTVLANTLTTTQTFRCGGTNVPQGCTSLDVTVISNAANVGPVTIQISYQPDLPAVNTPLVQTVTNALTVVQSVTLGGFIQPFGFRFTCQSNFSAAELIQPTPGQLGGLGILAVGILPATLLCTVENLDANGALLPLVAPGTYEVTTLSGTLVDEQGRLSTNLRIGCGTAVVVPPAGGTINPNTCQGVRFGIIGQAVGTVEVRVRYEPSTIAAQAGIDEVEGSFVVGWVAPAVVPSLLLSPNPVVAGATGTATVRFNRSANCAAAFGTGSIQGGTVCIDPTTGQPIIFNFGSILNGNVVLTIANTAHAVWAESVTPQTPSSFQSTGFTATAAQVTRRCGFFPTTGIISTAGQVPATTGPLANFFGGCDTVSAVYRGVLPGVTNITATFIADLPGSWGSNALSLTQQVTPLIGLFGNVGFNTSQRVLEVVAAPPSGVIQLARGCNNVSPTVTESATAYAARVAPAGALVAIWEHQAATNTFRGFSPQAGAPNDLAGTTRLRPVYVCVNNAATLDQPPA